jgi:hypothetical protein
MRKLWIAFGAVVVLSFVVLGLDRLPHLMGCSVSG